MTFNEESLTKSHEAQRQLYGEGYSAEMSRRAKQRKTQGHGGFRDMKLNHPEKFAKLLADREKKRKDEITHDRTQED